MSAVALVAALVSFCLVLLAATSHAQEPGSTTATGPVDPTNAPTNAPTSQPPESTTTLDTLPPEVPVTRPTSLTTLTPTTTTTLTTLPAYVPSSDPTLAPVCASAVGAIPVTTPMSCRIVAYYGTPLASTMGILGRLPRSEMPKALLADVRAWAAADPSVTTRCAFEVIAIVAQASKGRSGLFRSRIGAGPLDAIIQLARANGCITILDFQVGQSSVPIELPYFLHWLAQPDVHLALDPEWDMPPGVAPGKKIGSMDAVDINSAIATVTQLVRTQNIPPKLVIVHRFRDFMVTNPGAIRPTPEVRLLMNMDGFGPPASKLAVYARVRTGVATDLTGFKLFTKLDTPMLQPADVLSLTPPPMFINYQ